VSCADGRIGFVNHDSLGLLYLHEGQPVMNQPLTALLIVAGFATFEALFAFALVKLNIDL